jgi:hypothetical protein
MSDWDDSKLSVSPIKQARERADGQCEVMVRHGYLWVRCPGFASDVHHMLPRARGGLLLDAHREAYHLVVLCRPHHHLIHTNPRAAEVAGLTIEGRVITNKSTGRLRYLGPDWYLSRKYGDRDEFEEAPCHRPADHVPPRPLAGPARRRPVTGVGRAVGGRSTHQWSA